MAGSSSKLVQDLNSVPSIIGALGINIAEAQKALNLDYMENLERLLMLIKSLLDPKKKDGKAVPTGDYETVIKELLQQLAPSRYQFTETNLKVKLDLAQTMDVGSSASFSAGMGAFAVNAGMTVGFGYDYRAAAEVNTVLHAIPANKDIMTSLLNRADSLSKATLALPDMKDVDQAVLNKAHDVVSKLLAGKDDSKPAELDKPGAEQGGAGTGDTD